MNLFDMHVSTLLGEEVSFDGELKQSEHQLQSSKFTAQFQEHATVAKKRITALINAYKLFNQQFQQEITDPDNHPEKTIEAMRGLSNILAEPAYPYLQIKP